MRAMGLSFSFSLGNSFGECFLIWMTFTKNLPKKASPGVTSDGRPPLGKPPLDCLPGEASEFFPGRNSFKILLGPGQPRPGVTRSYLELIAWLFIAFFFAFLLKPLWNVTFPCFTPKYTPKWKPNPPKLQSKMRPKSIFSCERSKVNPSKHSHTFAHFCPSKRHENAPKIVSETAFLLNELRNGTKIVFFDFSSIFASELAPTWPPKNRPKSTQNLQYISEICRKPTWLTKTGQRPPTISKNLPQTCETPTWPPKNRPASTQNLQNLS